MRYFKVIGGRLKQGEAEWLFETGQIKAEGPVEALETFANIFRSTTARENVEDVFAKGGFLVLKENK